MIKTIPVACMDVTLHFHYLACANSTQASVYDLMTHSLVHNINFDTTKQYTPRSIKCELDRLITSDYNNDIKEYLFTGETHTLKAHDNTITSIHSDTHTITTASLDKTIKRWDRHTHTPIQTLAPERNNPWAHTSNCGGVHSMFCQGYALAAGYNDGVIRCFDLRTPSKTTIRELRVNDTSITTTLKFDDRYLVSGSSDKSLRIWDLRNHQITDTLLFPHHITSIDFNPEKVLVGAGENDCYCYERGGKLIRLPDDTSKDGSDSEIVVGRGFHTTPVTSVRMSGAYGYSGSMDGIVTIWNI